MCTDPLSKCRASSCDECLVEPSHLMTAVSPPSPVAHLLSHDQHDLAWCTVIDKDEEVVGRKDFIWSVIRLREVSDIRGQKLVRATSDRRRVDMEIVAIGPIELDLARKVTEDLIHVRLQELEEFLRRSPISVRVQATKHSDGLDEHIKSGVDLEHHAGLVAEQKQPVA